MYGAQVTKMQRSMERSDQDKARVEEQLATAIALNHSGDKQVSFTDCLHSHRPVFKIRMMAIEDMWCMYKPWQWAEGGKLPHPPAVSKHGQGFRTQRCMRYVLSFTLS